ncbi:MAG: cation:proton antiporter [Candidatus Micrarchaeia archaeon]
MDLMLPIVQIGGVVLAALSAGYLAKRTGLSSSLGYILAGVLLGPLALGYLAPSDWLTALFGEIGLVTLMFYLGLELNVKRFKENGAAAVALVLAEMLAAFAVGFGAARLFGFGFTESLVIGALLPMASTVIVTKFLLEKGLMKTREAGVCVSALIVEDFAAILVLVLLSTLSTHGGSFSATALNGLLFVIAAFYLLNKLSKPVLGFLEKRGQEEQMALFAVGAGILVSYAGTLLGLSSVLGAFFAGFALSETKYGERIKRELGLFREFFVLFFFVSFGASVALPSAAIVPLLVALVALRFVAKVLVYGSVGAFFGQSNQSAVDCGVLMTPIGEFSLIIAAAASGLVANPAEVMGLAFLLVILTTAMGPWLYDKREKIAALFARVYPARYRLASAALANGAAREGNKLGAALESEWTRVFRRLFRNFALAVAIVYVSYLLDLQISFPFIPGPSAFSLGPALLLLVAWPAFDSIKTLAGFTNAGIRNTLKAYPEASARLPAKRGAQVFTGIVLVLLGAVACAAAYNTAPPLFLVLPVAFTAFALAYLARALRGFTRGLLALPPVRTPAKKGNAHTVRALAKYFHRNPPRLKGRKK